MKHIKGNPAAALPDGASKADLAWRLINSKNSKTCSSPQPLRIVEYVVDQHNFVVEVRLA